jgi:hypothetical protein
MTLPNKKSRIEGNLFKRVTIMRILGAQNQKTYKVRKSPHKLKVRNHFVLQQNLIKRREEIKI